MHTSFSWRFQTDKTLTNSKESIGISAESNYISDKSAKRKYNTILTELQYRYIYYHWVT